VGARGRCVPQDTGVAIPVIYPDFFQPHGKSGGRSGFDERDKEQVAGLELGHMLALCSISVLHTHIPNIAVFTHQVEDGGGHQETTGGGRGHNVTGVLDGLLADQGLHSETGAP
jgi:hypothetical protein